MPTSTILGKRVRFAFPLLACSLLLKISDANAAGAIEEPPITESDRSHWAFQPLTRPALPHPQKAHQANNPIDLFILEELEKHELQLSPRASRRTLIRRLAFDLIGLPPSPEEVALFVNDPRPDAYAKLVDRYLASPQYGERWAQHWLDLARFAESDGFEHDIVRKNAWRYRDWVIDAFNGDLPYDQFVQAQISGDEMASTMEDGLALATGFLLAGPDMPDINLTSERKHNVLNEITSTVGAVFMGLGVGCAQCHDHKFDPFSQADFYRLRSFFDNMDFPDKNKQLGHVIREPGSAVPTSHLAIRGDFRRQGPELSPAFPRIINHSQTKPQFEVRSDRSSYRRTTLGAWLTREDHPLTSRVLANRLWQHHFGRALVGTPNDFGTQGLAPTHPKLLDYLATELVRHRWSLKRMHRSIVSSATYCQSSTGEGPEWERGLQIDPQNEWLSRMNRRRLSGESLRDAMLSASGQLNDRQGGPSDRPPLPAEVHATLLRKNHWVVNSDPADHHRRSVYVFVRRNLRYPIFDVFDRPDANASCAQRSVTTTAPQSLSLLNSELSLNLSQALARRALLTSGRNEERLIQQLYQLTLGRPPTTEEETSLKRFFENRFGDQRKMDNENWLAVGTEVSLALFNLNEFLYVD